MPTSKQLGYDYTRSDVKGNPYQSILGHDKDPLTSNNPVGWVRAYAQSQGKSIEQILQNLGYGSHDDNWVRSQGANFQTDFLNKVGLNTDQAKINFLKGSIVPASQRPENAAAIAADKAGGSASVGGASDGITPPPASSAFKNSSAYKGLSQGERDMVDLLFDTLNVGGQEEANTFAQAIQQAMAKADPWVKAQLALGLAEFAGNVDETIFGFKAKTDAIKRARDILSEDVSSAKEFLTLEQQADVATQIRAYDEDLLTIADQAAEKGITFATGARSRALAEQRRGEQFQDVIQSGNRQYNFRIKELGLRASRGDEEARTELDKLQGEQNFALGDIGLAAETVLGSANLPATPGYTPVGGVGGTIQETAEAGIVTDVNAIIGLNSNLLSS